MEAAATAVGQVTQNDGVSEVENALDQSFGQCGKTLGRLQNEHFSLGLLVHDPSTNGQFFDAFCLVPFVSILNDGGTQAFPAIHERRFHQRRFLIAAQIGKNALVLLVNRLFDELGKVLPLPVWLAFPMKTG